MEDDGTIEEMFEDGSGPDPDLPKRYNQDWKPEQLTVHAEEAPPPKPKPEKPVTIPLDGDDQKRWIRRLWLAQGWSYKRIASHMRLPQGVVRNYVIKAGLVEKRKDKTWTNDDLLLAEDVASRALERQMLAERTELAAAKKKGEEAAVTVVREVMNREKIAKEALIGVAEQLKAMTARLQTSLEHMEEEQRTLGITNARDLKDVSATILNLVRAGRELSGERGAGDKTAQKHPPIRIGVMGTVRISGGDVSVHDNGMAVDV